MPFLPLTQGAESLHPQLVVTLGPMGVALARALADAGATSFRLNASHLSPERLDAALTSLERQIPEAPVVVDLQGAKLRLGALAPREIAVDERLCFSLDGEAGALPLPHPELFAAAARGAQLGCDDGRLRFEIEAYGADWMRVRSLSKGTLSPRKGINLMEHPVRLTRLTAHDQACIGATRGRAAFAFSFMEDGREAEWVRGEAPGSLVIGKIERAEALAALDSLAARVDALWICRGDLGEQLGMAPLARFVAGFQPNALPKPVLMAGQVLHHLSVAPQPTRSELCHLYDLLARGYAGIVLSDETACGAEPIAAVSAASEILNELARNQHRGERCSTHRRSGE